jgi:hypothetical protein
MISDARNTYKHREPWLYDLTGELRPVYAKLGVELPANIRVSCGFPSVGGRSGLQRQTVGECWPPIASADGSFEILISPTVADSMRVAGVLAHELIHVAKGPGHKGQFKRLASAIGLTGRMTATQEGEEFKRQLAPILENLGPYPHAELDTRKWRVGPPVGEKDMWEEDMWTGPKVQGTRLHKVMCRHCGYIARVTMKWLNEGMPVCPKVGHGSMMMAPAGEFIG